MARQPYFEEGVPLERKVLLFNSRLKLFPDKLKSRWSDPFKIKQVFPFGAVELLGHDGHTFRINGQILKHYFGMEERKVEDIHLEEPRQ